MNDNIKILELEYDIDSASIADIRYYASDLERLRNVISKRLREVEDDYLHSISYKRAELERVEKGQIWNVTGDLKSKYGRPCLIMAVPREDLNNLKLVTVIPLTNEAKQDEFKVKHEGNNGYFNIQGIYSLDINDLIILKEEKIDEITMSRVDATLSKWLNLNQPTKSFNETPSNILRSIKDMKAQKRA